MIRENQVWIASNEKGEAISMLPKMMNRHGLIAGATGTGKTVTLKVMAESLSDLGIPVFMADVKGDIAAMMKAGEDSEDMQARIEKFGLSEHGFQYSGYPVTLWDIYGKSGVPLRTTISEMGPLLLSRILGLNDLQRDILTIIFKIADDNGLLLIDTKDLKSMIHYVREHAEEYAPDYGKISDASLGVITRAIVALEAEGAESFFAEPALSITDWMSLGEGGRGMIHILDSSSLIHNGKLYSTFLLWMLSELFEMLPEVGDMEKPKMVFFFDEAHLLFADAPKVLLDKIEQLVKLIRSKGVGVYFCTQNPRDIPDGVLAQLGNKVEHGLRAYTPAEQKSVRVAAESFRENPEFDTYETILALGTGEAVISFLDEKGVPMVAEKGYVLPPRCSMDAITDAERDACVKSSILYSKYATLVDNDSAYEFLKRKGLEEEAEKEAQVKEAQAAKEVEKAEKEAAKAAEKAEKDAAKAAEKAEKEAQKLAEKAEKQAQREAEKAVKERQKAIERVGRSVMGTVGREVGKNVGKNFGTFGKTLGGNVGSSIGRGLMDTLFKK